MHWFYTEKQRQKWLERERRENARITAILLWFGFISLLLIQWVTG
jgi:hypothetical protein